MDKTYEITVKLLINDKDEYSAKQNINIALKDMCEHYGVVAFVYDDIHCVGTKIN